MQIKIHKGQYEVATDPHQFRVVVAGRRWGKSVLARLIVYQWALKQYGLYWIVTPTFTQGKKIHWLQGIRREAEAIFGRGWVKFNDSELQITIRRTGSVIQIVSAENPDRLVGVKLKGLIVDEVARLRNWDLLWKEALLPTLTDYNSPAVFISTPRGYNHFYQLYMQGQGGDPNWKSWRFTSYDNPYIPHEVIDKNREIMTENYFQQEYMSEFKKFVGLVFPEFDRETHIKDIDIDQFKPVYWIRGCDRGFRNPSAVCFIAVNADGEWYQTNEVYQAGLTNPQLSDRIKQISGIRGFELSTMDSSDASDIKDLNDLQANLDFLPVKKEAGEKDTSYVRWKIQKFAERLKVKANGKPSYYVHPRCENTIMEFEKYSYPEVKEEEAEQEVPVKLNDHMMDALTDLNAMYLHFYEEEKKPAWAGKPKGTYIEPAIVEQEETTGWTAEPKDNYWDAEEI